MGATDTSERWGRDRIGWFALAGLVVLIGGAFLYHCWARPPQMGTSAEVFRTVDALYTAVRSQDEKRVGECEQRLHGYRDAGKLPPSASDALDAIIRKTRSGSWEAAAERLYDFMLAQRREGVIEHHHHNHAKKGKTTRATRK